MLLEKVNHPTINQPTNLNRLKLYLNRQSAGIGAYISEQLLYVLFGWIPSIIGVGLRALFYRYFYQISLFDANNGVSHRVLHLTSIP